MIEAALGIGIVGVALGYAIGYASGLRRGRVEAKFELTFWKARASDLEKESGK